ncbi:MAG: hypothetical protein KatS3mg011_0724 [Acidimicrobiia bacterium]|nr:MAG: hypothetical protein KatS3mg011_0724 [Acidimicrobiia bacterium]
MDRELGLALAATGVVVVLAEIGGLGTRFPKWIQTIVRLLSFGVGLILFVVGVFAVVAETFSGPTTEPSRLVWAVPVVVTVAGGLLVWGSERWEGQQAAWLRRSGWVVSIAGVSLTALSDLYLLVAIVMAPSLLTFSSPGEVESAGRRGRVTAS